ncbi:MAG TPA: SPOR domain-containing protein [Gemmatimonadota bacterium]|nr:SPOR domain-containing protein [Gemmatimonadota bacterium]
MRPGRRSAALLSTVALLAVVTALACASSPERGAEPTPDRSGDPEFEAAREAARPDFESQAEALAAGVYEPFVHPDSVAAAGGAGAARPAPITTPRDRGDPSTAELLGTLGSDDQYNQGVPAARVPPAVAAPDPTSRDGLWTLQMGAFGSDTGALVRIRELQQRFRDLPAWRVAGPDGLVRVFLGRFQDEHAGARARDRIRAAGYADAWVVRAP